MKTKNPAAVLQIIPFVSAKKWQQWLAKNHNDSKGLWIKVAKKDSGIATVTIEEALENALKKLDEHTNFSYFYTENTLRYY